MRIFSPNSALIEACLPPWPVLSQCESQKITISVEIFLNKEFAMTPWFVAWPMALLQFIFLSTAFLRYGKRFTKQSMDQKNGFIELWCSCGIPFQSLIRLYRSLVLLAFMEHSLVRKALGLPNYVEHQEIFRSKRIALFQNRVAL